MNLKTLSISGLSALLILIAIVPSDVSAVSIDAPQHVTRAEAAMLILKRRIPAVPENPDTTIYPDIVANEWYTPYIVAAANMGMLQPDPDTNRLFPHRAISRAEYLKILTIALNLPTYRPHTYNDVASIHWYAPYAGVAADHNLFYSEDDPKNLHPNVPITHIDAANAFYTLMRQDAVLRRMYAYDQNNAFTVVRTRLPDAKPTQETVTTIGEGTKKVRTLIYNLIKRQASPEQLRYDLIIAVNETRKENGASPLRPNRLLDSAAEKHAEDMKKRGYFSHFTPEGVNYVDRIQAAGYTDVDPVSCGCREVLDVNNADGGPEFITYAADICKCRPSIALGENLAKGQIGVQEVMHDWMESPGHRDNILYGEFREIGIAIVGNIWVQTFGKFAME